MTNEEKWAKRVADWRASGKTSPAFCEGMPFTAGGLRHWAYLLRRRDEAASPTRAAVPIARVIRRDRPAIVPPAPPLPDALVVECGPLRVAIRPGFDRQALAAVLELVAACGGGR